MADDRAAGPGGSAEAGKPWSGGGREELATAVRRLASLTVAASATQEVLRDAAERAGALADELDRWVPVPGPHPRARFADESVASGEATGLADAMPFDMVIGRCNPIAPPIEMEFEGDRAIGRTVFGPQFEGGPGMVHGAALAGAFDIILTGANVLADGAGPTVTLTLSFLSPTLVGEEAVFEAWVTSVDGRRTFSEGRLVQDGVVTVEARGEFARLDRARIERLHRRPGGRTGATSGGSDSGSLES